MDELMIKIDNISKQYKLGEIGGTTLRDELQRLRAKRRGEEDPTKRIDAKNYNKGETFLALDRVSFEVRKGERVGIIGHNGAGKSTLLKLISRVTAPTGGTIGLNGRVASMLEVGTGFHGELTGRENIYMNGAILGMTKKEIDAKMENIIEFSECRQFIDTPVKRYSSGMYVKLAFSVAAHLDSEIMIMDEVLAVGDMAFQKKCLEKMSDVSKTEGRTILYVSHNINTIRQLCDRVIVLKKGKLLFDGNVEDGIQKYMELESYDAWKANYEDYKRTAGSGKQIRLYSAEYTEMKTSYPTRAMIPIKFCWKNFADIEKLCLRIELRKADRSPIGAAILYDFYSGSQQDWGEAVIAIDTSFLAPGNYCSTYSFFLRNNLGRNVNMDSVQGLNFEIIRDMSDIVWDSGKWGSVCFPPLQLIEKNSTEIMK